MLEDWQEANMRKPTMSLLEDAQQLQPASSMQLNVQHQNSLAGSVRHQWLPPSNGRFKCNVDAAISGQY